MTSIDLARAHSRASLFRRLPLALAASALFSGQAIAQSADAPSAPPAPLAAAQGQLTPIEVVGRTESGAYHADEAAGAKSDLP